MSTNNPETTQLESISAHTSNLRERRRAVTASFLGTTVEYYDFLLYTAAAGLIFPALFFSNLEPGLATTLSFATLLAGYLTRPLGGILFGHFGDKVGRKKILFITLMTMGVVSLGIGLMPTYATIGVTAPVLLVILRILQGIAVGGEWAGATLMAMEHANEKSKGLAASFSAAGGPTGSVLATLTLASFASLPNEAFFSWGWRVPFLLSVVVVIIGLYMRSRVTESPEFEEARQNGEVEKGAPIKIVLTTYRKEVVLGALGGAASLFVQGLLAGFMVTYVSVIHGWLPRTDALMMLTASSFLQIFTIPFFAWLSDKWGRKPVMLYAAICSAILVWPMMALFNTGQPLLIFAAFMLGNPILQASMYGPVAAFISEKFDTAARYTGASLTFQTSSIIGAGIAPIIGATLTSETSGSNSLAIFMTALFIVSASAVWFSRETRPSASRTRKFASFDKSR
ncbi:MFS family permease [Arthrobacter bambusae]|uniref:MFS family permease n=1 Tax=Arthrobacter bambusae TaxID=1338426 RepID=A0ABV2P0X6_9MICC